MIFRQWLTRLPDKGKRIQDVHDRITEELNKRNEIDNAAELFSELNIVSKGKRALNSLEWNGSYTKEDEVIVDSDDDDEELDPLKILAQSRGTVKIVKTKKLQSNLITESDLEEIKTFETDTKVTLSSASSQQSVASEIEPHVNYVCSMEAIGEPIRPKFKPYYTTKTNVHEPGKEILKKHGSKWENTSATPPLLQHAGTKVLTLHESIELQMKQRQTLKEFDERQAVERLKAKDKRLEDRVRDLQAHGESIKFLNEYRIKKDEIDSDDDEDDDKQLVDSDDEVYDECDEESKGGVSVVAYE